MELFYRTYPLSEIQEILFDANEFIRANKKRSSKGNDGKSTSQTDSDSEKRGNEKNKQQRLKLYPGSKKDYETLGLANGSKLEEVKKEYRKLARQYHPDLNPGNEKAEEQFKQVTEAKDRLEDALESDSAMSAADAPGGIDLSLTTIRFEGTSEIKMLNPPVSLDTATMIGFMFQIQNTQPITNLQNYLMPL